MLLKLFISCWISILLFLTPCTDAVNSASIKAATEFFLRRMQSQIEENYQIQVESNEAYTLCDVYDLCQDPPTLFSDSSKTIDDWLTSGTPWHNPQCDESEVLIGVKPNNHNPDTGKNLTSDTCPASNEYIACNYDNSNSGAGIKIPYDTDTDSQDFIDATCFTHELEEISTTRVYSDCHTDAECYMNNLTDTDDSTDTQEIYCEDYGICSTTDAIPPVGSFAPEYVEYQYYGDQRTGIILNIPAMYWDPSNLDTCPGTYDPRFRPWYVFVHKKLILNQGHAKSHRLVVSHHSCVKSLFLCSHRLMVFVCFFCQYV